MVFRKLRNTKFYKRTFPIKLSLGPSGVTNLKPSPWFLRIIESE